MKKYLLFILSSAVVSFSWAQNQDPASPGFDFNMMTTDSTSTESSEGGDGSQSPEATPAKPYERIVLAMDTITNLIVYTGVVEQEESSSDSLYARTKSFAQKFLAGGPKADPKVLFDVDKKNQKLVINGVLTAYSYSNKYTKREIGTYQFKMTVLFKEGRYKYTITNLVHEGLKPNIGVPQRNYFEYYYTTTTGIRQVDQILRFADKDITKMLENYKKAMKEKLELDEDEW